MEIKTSVNPQGQIYIPSKVREAIGMKPKKQVILIGNARSVFVIPAEMSAEDALKSLEVIAKHLQHKKQMEKMEC